MSTILEVAVEGLACRLSREALVQAIEARDPAAVVTFDPAGGNLCADTELDLEALLEVIGSAGPQPVLAA